MARQKTSKSYATFSQGLVTEATELTFPENASQDELNMELSIRGNRRRRRGLDYETNHVLSNYNFTAATVQDEAIANGVWTAVGGCVGLESLDRVVG